MSCRPSISVTETKWQRTISVDCFSLMRDFEFTAAPSPSDKSHASFLLWEGFQDTVAIVCIFALAMKLADPFPRLHMLSALLGGKKQTSKQECLAVRHAKFARSVSHWTLSVKWLLFADQSNKCILAPGNDPTIACRRQWPNHDCKITLLQTITVLAYSVNTATEKRNGQKMITCSGMGHFENYLIL